MVALALTSEGGPSGSPRASSASDVAARATSGRPRDFTSAEFARSPNNLSPKEVRECVESILVRSAFLIAMLELNLGGGAFIPAKDHELYDSRLGPQEPFKTLGVDLNLGLSLFLFEYFGVGVEGGFMPVRTEGDKSVF